MFPAFTEGALTGNSVGGEGGGELVVLPLEENVIIRDVYEDFRFLSIIQNQNF